MICFGDNISISATEKDEMMTMETVNKGNIAIQVEVWTVDIELAKRIKKVIGKYSRNSYWHSHVTLPLRWAVKNGQSVVKVTTAGFMTGEFSNFAALAR